MKGSGNRGNLKLSITLLFLGPISEVEWVEEVVPVFGKIQILKRDGKAEPSSNKIVLIFSILVGGCLLLGLYMKQKTNEEEKKTNTGKMKEQNRDIASRSEADPTRISVKENVIETVNIKRKREEDLEKEKEKQREREKEREKEEEKQKEIKRGKEKQKYKEKEKERQNEMEKEESPIKIIPVKQFIEEEKSLEDGRFGEVSVLSESAECNSFLPQDTVKHNCERKRKGREETDIGDILQAQLLDLDDGPEWISKIKTFKMTKVRQRPIFEGQK